MMNEFDYVKSALKDNIKSTNVANNEGVKTFQEIIDDAVLSGADADKVGKILNQLLSNGYVTKFGNYLIGKKRIDEIVGFLDKLKSGR